MRLVDLFLNPSYVAIQHADEGVFATDVHTLWNLTALPDLHGTPETSGVHQVLATRPAKYQHPRPNWDLPDRFANQMAQSARTGDHERLRWTPWRLGESTIATVGKRAILIDTAFEHRLRAIPNLSLWGGKRRGHILVRHTTSVTSTDMPRGYDHVTTVGFIQEEPIGPASRTVIDAIVNDARRQPF